MEILLPHPPVILTRIIGVKQHNVCFSLCNGFVAAIAVVVIVVVVVCCYCCCCCSVELLFVLFSLLGSTHWFQSSITWPHNYGGVAG